MDLTPALLASLQKLQLFVDLSPPQIKRMVSACRQESFEAGAVLCHAGRDSDRMFIIVSGSVDILSSSDTQLAHETAVTTIGETGLLSGETRAATVRVRAAASALVIHKRPLQQLMQDDSGLAIRLYRNAMVLVRKKLIAADQRLERVLRSEDSVE
jgi:CRP-like cAMP-binding protein